MILIADSGSTKTRWALVEPGSEPAVITTSGINPVIMAHTDISDLIATQLVPELKCAPIDTLYFYGAGCATPQICADMADLLASAIMCNNVYVGSDLLGAARSLCCHSGGIACILGTGSNSCLFNGKEITEHTPPLGYILGDEGSGAVIGRTLIGNILKRRLPDEIISEFHNRYGLSAADIIERVYRRPTPNVFLASFMPFISAHISHPEIERMVVEQFTLFLERNVAGYTGARSLPVNFTGSLALHFAPQLNKAAETMQLSIGKIIADPLPGLICYHR